MGDVDSDNLAYQGFTDAEKGLDARNDLGPVDQKAYNEGYLAGLKERRRYKQHIVSYEQRSF